MGKAYAYEYLPEVLNENEVMELFRQYKNGNIMARNKLISCNLRFIIHIVDLRFSNAKYEKSELISIGQIGLIKAVDSYNPERKIKFATYASKCIYNEICMMIRSNKKKTETVSLDSALSDFLNSNSDDFDKIPFIAFFKDDNLLPNELVEQKDLCSSVLNAVNRLNERDKIIIKMLYGFEKIKYTQKEVAEILGISQSYVSKLEKAALFELKNILLEEGAFESSNKYLGACFKKDRILHTA